MDTLTNTLDKKVLIISGYTPPATHGSGLMMFHLLSQFPKGSLAFVTEKTDTNPLLSKYSIDAPYYHYGNPILSIDFNANDAVTTLQKTKRFVKNLPVVSFFGQLFFLAYSIYRIIQVGKRAILTEKPTILVGYSDFGPNLIATYLLHTMTGTPFAVYMYDMYLGNKIPPAAQFLANIFEPIIFKKAVKIFVMCDPLKEHYAKKYNRNDIVVIYNSLLPVEQKGYNTTNRDTSVFTIAYIGNIYWAQEQSLRNLIQAVHKIHDHPILLKIYTNNTKSSLKHLGIEDQKKIHITKCLPEEVPSVLASVDLAFIGLSFETKYPTLINTSSPGRLCDFIRSNTPILVHAPRESFLSQYAKTNDFAFVVDENDVDKLTQTILHILQHKELASTKVANAHMIDAKNHNAILNAHTYFEALKL